MTIILSKGKDNIGDKWQQRQWKKRLDKEHSGPQQLCKEEQNHVEKSKNEQTVCSRVVGFA